MRQVFRPHFAVTITFLFLVSVAGVQVASAQTAVAGQLLISEFRLSGPNGAEDEFIEIYNNSGADHTVVAASGTGYGVAASDGTVRCSIPNGFTLTVGGHYLCVNSDGYSLGSYPAGNETSATGDASYTTDIPENSGLALFNNNTGGASFSLANRLDAVGASSVADPLYKEGTGYPALGGDYGIDYSFYRKIVGTCTNAPNNCGLVSGSFPLSGAIAVQDTDDNATDFVFVDTNGTSAGAGQRLGAPGPENSNSPVFSDVFFSVSLLDSTLGRHQSPNRERDFTSNPAQNSTFGTISFRRRITNESASNVSRLRFRIVDQTTFPAVSGVADLRARNSAPVVVAVVNDPATCAAKSPSESAPCAITAEATILEQPPSQPNGGGYNSSLSPGAVQQPGKPSNGPGSITLLTPIPPGGSINVEFLMGIQQTGTYRFYVGIEAILDAVIPERPKGEGLAKKTLWTNRAGPVTGIIDATPVTFLKSGTSSGWFVVVPARRTWAPSNRKGLVATEAKSEEKSEMPAIKKSRNTPEALHLTAPLGTANPGVKPARSAAASPAKVAAPAARASIASTPAALPVTSAPNAADEVKPVKSPKQRRKSRQSRGKTLRKR